MGWIVGRGSRIVTALATVVISAAMLAACSMFGPARDADGRVTETAVIGSTTLEVGDCFSFVEGSNNSEAEVTPCSEEHAYIVIGRGELSTAEVDEAGGVQNAVSAACAEDFATFKEAATEGTKPQQEFIVAQKEKDGASVTSFHCVATDAPVEAAG